MLAVGLQLRGKKTKKTQLFGRKLKCFTPDTNGCIDEFYLVDCLGQEKGIGSILIEVGRLEEYAECHLLPFKWDNKINTAIIN